MTDTMTKATCEDYGTSACHIITNRIGETICMCNNARRARGEIKDSGNRTEFATGAVRDIQRGKGRFDLMPLDAVENLLWTYEHGNYAASGMFSDVIAYIDKFKKDGTSDGLFRAVCCYARATRKDIFALMLDVARHFENGALKYGEHNWQKGIPISRYVDSVLRHLMKDLAGETDEDHAAAFVWNCMCAAWTMEHLPAMDDYTLERKTCAASKIDV